MEYTIVCKQTKWPIKERVYIRPNTSFDFMKTDKVTLEHQKFEEYYDVECQDDMLARMVLTPNVMDALSELATNGEQLAEVTLFENKIHIKKRVQQKIITINWLHKVDIGVMKKAYKDLYKQIMIIEKIAKTINVEYFGKQ
jgi:hypothetical protein